jgi:hypothetical protein
MINYLLLGPDETQEGPAGGEHAFPDMVPGEMVLLQQSDSKALCLRTFSEINANLIIA